MATEKVSTSIFLLKSSQVSTFQREVLEQVSGFPLAGLDGRFFPFPGQSKPPSWVAAVMATLQQPTAQDQNLTLNTQSPSGLLVINRNDKTFVITFGHAWLRLKDEWLEQDFGRRVALNAIPTDKLLEINIEQVFAKWHLARERAPRASAFEEFGVDYDRDFVSAIEGVPSEGVFGSVIRGGTSLRVTIDLKTLANVLDKAASSYRSKKYQKHWPEIDNLIPVVDQTLIERLEAQLDKDIATGVGVEKVILFAPMLRRENAHHATSFVFGRLINSAARAPYLTYGSWESFLKRTKKEPSVETAKRTCVHLLDEGYSEIAGTTVYHCFGYETSSGKRQYVLSSGVWYEAVPDFIESINRRINSLRSPSIPLLSWDQVCSEGDYNLNCYKKMTSSLLHFDAKNVSFGGGRSKFEFCDLMHPGKRILYFAKIPSRSSDLSHLAEQTRRTVELFFNPDNRFREEIRKTMINYYPKCDRRWLDTRPRSGDWDLCLVSLGRKAKDLPFFAKCGLSRLVKDLEERGHLVSFIAV